MKRKILIKFEGDEKMIAGFMSWLDGQGEQDYWTYSDPNDQIDRFTYDYKKGEIVGERNDAEMEKGPNHG